MASVVITLRIMPEAPDSDLKAIENKATELITSHGAKVGKVTISPVAFGLNSVDIMFIMDESKGSTDALEQQIAAIPQVNGVEVTDVRRTIG